MREDVRIRGLILEVPYTEKDEAKALGAWWDPQIKKWFVPKGRDTTPFERWFPKDEEENSEREFLD